MATRAWGSSNDIYSASESEEELDDVFEEKSEQDVTLHGANKNTMTQKTKESNKRPSDFLSYFRIGSSSVYVVGDGRVVGDVGANAILSDSEDEFDKMKDILREKRSLRDRFLKICQEIDGDGTFDVERITPPEKNRKYEVLKREGATPTHMIRTFLSMITSYISTRSAPQGVDPCFLGHMPFKAWKKCVEDMYVVLEILKGSADIVIGVREGLECDKGKTFIFGNLIVLLETIDVQLFRRLQCVDLGPQELVEIARNEYFLFDLVQNFQQYFVSIKDFKWAAKSAQILMGILYYKNQDMYDLMRDVASVEFGLQVAKTPGFSNKPLTFPENCMVLVYDVACFISEHGDKRTKTHAALCYIYNLAIMGQYVDAVNVLRDSGLLYRRYMSTSTLLLFNRTVAQLGLCSFRVGCIEIAHELLYNFHGEWAKKLLKQGKPGQSGCPYNDAGQEFLLGRRKQMPRHMHVNLQHLQLAYQLCDEILVTGSQPKGATEVKLTGIPKDVEDHIVAARKWDFSKLSSVVEPPDFWMLPNNYYNQSHLS